MKRLALVCTTLLLARASVAQTPRKPPAAKGKPTVSVVGLRVVGPGFGRDGMEVRPFNEQPGTGIVVALEVAEPFGVIAVDTRSSAIEKIADSDGTVLPQPEIWFSPDITKDGTAALVQLRASGVPGAKATAVTLKGTLVASVSSGAKTQKVSNFKLEAGKTLKVGNDTITLSAVAGEESQNLTFKGPRIAFQSLKAIRFRDTKGAEVTSDQRGYSFGTDEGEVYYAVTSAAKAFNLELDVWQNIQPVSVPFELQAGLGVGQP
jgi:hypothetical protein